MRNCVLLGLVVACAKPAPPARPDVVSGRAPAPAPVELAAPAVAVPDVLAKNPAQLPILVLLDEHGLRIAEGPATWEELKLDPGATARTIVTRLAGKPLHDATEMLGRMILENVALGRPPHHLMAELGTGTQPIAFDEDTRTGGTADDPPPPPPEEDDTDESGGTGTAMALDEGKMGSRDSNRAPAVVPPGPVGPLAEHRPVGARPQRQADFVGAVAIDRELSPEQRALVIAAPHANAQVLIDVLENVRGLIGVRYRGAIRPLRLDFVRRGYDLSRRSDHWLEVRIGPAGLELEGVPDKAVTVAWRSGPLDGATVAKAYEAAVAQRALSPDTIVDVLVDPTTDAQRLIDVLVALDGAGARWIGLGVVPTGPEAGLRGKRIPTARLGGLNLAGEISRLIVRDAVEAHIAELTACYATALAKRPALEGTVNVQFFIKPDGNVASSAGAGVDPAVATCAAAVIKLLVFKKGRGGTQVNAPILFSN